MSKGEGPGARLRAERESLGVTIREVAETLNLSMSTVEALESNDYERLPGPVFARGYVRAYARLLELAPEELVARYPQEVPVPDVVESTEPPVWEWIRRRPALVLGVAAGVVLLLVALLGMLVWPMGNGPEPAGTDAVYEEPEFADTEVMASAPELTAEAEPAAGGGAPQSGDDAGLDGSLAFLRRAAEPVAAEPTDAEPSSAVPETAQRITEFGNDRLTFRFAEDCWVEVRSASGVNLYSNLSRAGTTLRLMGEGPFRILLGYAPGVELTFNREAVPLGPHTRNNVATLVLGQ